MVPKFAHIRYFNMPPKTGGEMVSNVIYELLKEKFNSKEFFFPYSEKGISSRIITQTVSSFKSNLLALSLVKNGYQVYSGSGTGTFDYAQSPAGNHKFNKEFIGHKYLDIVDFVSRFGQNNIILAIYNSKFAYEYYKIKGAKYHEIIYPPIFRSYENNLNEKENIVLALSRISNVKRLELVGEISKEVKAKFIVAGYLSDINIEYYKKLKREYPNLIFFINIDEDTKFELLKKAKIFINTSLLDSFLITKIEAMSAGTIPIVLNSGGAPEGISKELVFNTIDEAINLINHWLDNYSLDYAKSLIKMSRLYNVNTFKENFYNVIKKYLI